MFLLIWIVFSDERFGPWTSCFSYSQTRGQPLFIPYQPCPFYGRRQYVFMHHHNKPFQPEFYKCYYEPIEIHSVPQLKRYKIYLTNIKIVHPCRSKLMIGWKPRRIFDKFMRIVFVIKKTYYFILTCVRHRIHLICFYFLFFLLSLLLALKIQIWSWFIWFLIIRKTNLWIGYFVLIAIRFLVYFSINSNTSDPHD